MIKRLKQIQTANRTISQWLKSGGELVDQTKSDTRAITCRGCPFNKRGSAWDYLTRFMAGFVDLPIPTVFKGLFSCQKCGCSLNLKVRMPLTNILLNTTPETIEQLPPDCWIITEAT